MPPKMSDRVDALEVKFEALEESLRLRMEEFQKMVMEEFAKLRSSLEASSTLSDRASSELKMAVKKVELPLFDSDDPVGWVTHAETYFEVQGSSEEVKVRLAKVCMEGEIRSKVPREIREGDLLVNQWLVKKEGAEFPLQWENCGVTRGEILHQSL